LFVSSYCCYGRVGLLQNEIHKEEEDDDKKQQWWWL